MKAILLKETHPDIQTAIECLEVVEKPVPEPGPGQVLIRVEAAPCNPSDLLFLQGKYGVRKSLPAVPGWEGAGTVVATGGGPFAWWLKGKRVAFAGQSDSDGSWAEYTVADAKACIVLDRHVDIQQGATLIINPLTAIGMIEQAVSEGHHALIQNAACSQVGRMMQALAKEKRLPLINIVRREEQKKELLSSGEKWVLNSSEEAFDHQLLKMAEELEATLLFDAVGGDQTGETLSLLPNGSKALVYGALSEKPCGKISPLSLIFEKKSVEGFWLTSWIEKNSTWHLVRSTRHIQKLMTTRNFQTKIRANVSFEKWKSALLDYQSEMTLGKVILTNK